jgi:acetylornithine deacetylase/succinyl-diaminopimelate desuccinylase-like protein
MPYRIDKESKCPDSVRGDDGLLRGHKLIPDDSVSPKTPEEMNLLQEVSEACGRPLDELVKVWREPSFSIANIVSSGAVNKTVIPRKVSADISMRIVPDQVSCCAN